MKTPDIAKYNRSNNFIGTQVFTLYAVASKRSSWNSHLTFKIVIALGKLLFYKPAVPLSYNVSCQTIGHLCFSLTSVSYTHLDVYKRQPLHTTPTIPYKQ